MTAPQVFFVLQPWRTLIQPWSLGLCGVQQAFPLLRSLGQPACIYFKLTQVLHLLVSYLLPC